MKKTYLTPILSAVLLTATAITAPSCINDLDISSIDPGKALQALTNRELS